MSPVTFLAQMSPDLLRGAGGAAANQSEQQEALKHAFEQGVEFANNQLAQQQESAGPCFIRPQRHCRFHDAAALAPPVQVLTHPPAVRRRSSSQAKGTNSATSSSAQRGV